MLDSIDPFLELLSHFRLKEGATQNTLSPDLNPNVLDLKETLIQMLQEMSLTKDEAGVLLYLLVFPGSTDADVSRHTGIANSAVAILAEGLMAKGLLTCSKSQNRPSRYYPIPDDAVIKILRKRQ